MSLIVGAVCAAAMLAAFFATRGVQLGESPSAPGGLVQQLLDTARNSHFRALALVYLVQILGIGTLVAAAPYFAVHVLGAGEALVGAMLLVMMGTATLSIPLWNTLAVRWGKKPSYYLAIMLLASSMIGLAWLGPATSYLALYVLLGTTGLGFGAQQVLPFAMLTDIIHHDVAGREGVTTGFWVANQKLGLALGPLSKLRTHITTLWLPGGTLEHNLAASKRHFRDSRCLLAHTSAAAHDERALTYPLSQPTTRAARGQEAGWNVTEETATPPLLERISDYLTWYAQKTPRAEALVLGTQRLTYQQLAFEVDSLSCALIAAGVRSGDRIATLATPHPDFFIVLLAASSIGAIWVGLNPRYDWRNSLTY